MKTFAKIQNDKLLSGVCSGMAYSIGLPSWLVRIAFVLLLCLPGSVVLYVLMWAFVPKWSQDPSDYFERTNRMYQDTPKGQAPVTEASPSSPAQ